MCKLYRGRHYKRTTHTHARINTDKPGTNGHTGPPTTKHTWTWMDTWPWQSVPCLSALLAWMALRVCTYVYVLIKSSFSFFRLSYAGVISHLRFTANKHIPSVWFANRPGIFSLDIRYGHAGLERCQKQQQQKCPASTCWCCWWPLSVFTSKVFHPVRCRTNHSHRCRKHTCRKTIIITQNESPSQECAHRVYSNNSVMIQQCFLER